MLSRNELRRGRSRFRFECVITILPEMCRISCCLRASSNQARCDESLTKERQLKEELKQALKSAEMQNQCFQKDKVAVQAKMDAMMKVSTNFMHDLSARDCHTRAGTGVGIETSNA